MKKAPRRYQTGGGVYQEPKKRLDNAKKVETVPQGYNEYGEIGGKKYYTKESQLGAARRSQNQGGAQYQEFLQNQLKSGVTPEELANKGYISSAQIENYRPHYVPSKDVVFTEKPTLTKAPNIPLDIDKTIDRKRVTQSDKYETWDYPDVNAGYSKATQRSFVNGREIDPIKSFDEKGNFVPTFKYPENDERGTATYGTQKNRSLSSGSIIQDPKAIEDINKKKDAQEAMSAGFSSGGTVRRMMKAPKIGKRNC